VTAQALDAARVALQGRLAGVLDGARGLGLETAGEPEDVRGQALALARSVMAFRLDDAVAVPAQPVVRWPRQRKGMRGPVRPGHPYLRLAVSRR
jgi:hypothetical protein